MPERYPNEPPLPGGSSQESERRFQDDPLAELARIVSGPSPLSEGGTMGYSLPGTPASANSAPNSSGPSSSALDENLESELTRSAGAQEGIDPFADLSWLDAEAAKPSAIAAPGAPPAASEPNFDEFVNLHMRRAGRPGMRRTPGRTSPPIGAGWDGIDLDQPPISREDEAAAATSRPAPSDVFSAPKNTALFGDAPSASEGTMSAGTATDQSNPAAFSEERFAENSALFGDFPDEDEASGRRGPSRAVLLAGAATILLALGFYGAFTYLNRDDGKAAAPGVIAADKNPVKVAPAAPLANAVAARDAAANNKLVYDRVDEPASDKLKTTPAPITTAARPEVQTTDAGRELARLAAEGAANDAADQSANVRRVRTVVVRPDGTVIANNPAVPAAAAPAVRPTTASPTTASPTTATTSAPSPASAGAVAARPAVANPAPAPAAASPPAAAAKTNTAPAPTNSAASATAAAAPKPPASAAAGGNTLVAANTPASTAVKPATPAAAAAKPAAAQAPVPLLPESADAKTAAASRTAAVAPNATAIAIGAEGWVVQITSQKSESAALTAFKDMQKRFPTQLGNRQPDMQRVDLGSRGIFYRVRVGPVGTQEAASGLCDTLKGGGADCIVVRN